MNWTNFFIGIVATAWVLSVEYRLWVNLRILTELNSRREKREASSHLHAVEK